jgi:Tfp pilus assembly protein PilF
VSARLAGLLGVLGVVALASCGGSRAPAQPPADGGKLRAQALVDSGNSAFRAADYTTAAKRYAAAAVVNPDDPAAFYGLGMALAKLGRDDEARVAYARSRELTRGEVDRDSMPHEVRYRRTTHP